MADHRTALMPDPDQAPGRLDPRRSENIGASESPALFSLDWDPVDEMRPFETRLHLWLRKAGRIAEADIDHERAYWGNFLEAGIGNGIAVKCGWTIDKGEFLLHPSISGMSASPDFRVCASPDRGLSGPSLIQVKCVDGLEYRRWREIVEPGVMEFKRGEWVPAKKQPPFRVKLQVQHELACADLSFGIIAALVGGNSLKLFRLPRHPMGERIEREIPVFWESIAQDRMPDPDWSLDAETLVAIFGETDQGTAIDLRRSKDALKAALEYSSWAGIEKEAKSKKTEMKARLLKMLGRAPKALLADGVRVSASRVDATASRGSYRTFGVYKPRPKREGRIPDGTS